MNEYYKYLQYLQQVLTRCQDVIWTYGGDHPLIVAVQSARDSLDKTQQAHSEKENRFGHRFSEWEREAKGLVNIYSNKYALVQSGDKPENEAREALIKLHAHLESVKDLMK